MKKKSKSTISILIPIQINTTQVEFIDNIKDFIQQPFEIVLLNVVDIRQKESLVLLDDKKADKNFEKIKSKAEKLLAEHAEKIGAQSMVVEGVPFLEIIKIAKDLKVDLIVMKTRSVHNQRRLEDLLFGSTTERVVRGSNIPVICIP